MKRIVRFIREAPDRHPYIPLALSIIALIASIAMPILRRFLEGMT